MRSLGWAFRVHGAVAADRIVLFAIGGGGYDQSGDVEDSWERILCPGGAVVMVEMAVFRDGGMIGPSCTKNEMRARLGT